MLYKGEFGFINSSTRSIDKLIGWNEDEYDFFHRWSYNTFLTDYGYYGLDKYFGTQEAYLITKLYRRNLALKYTMKGKAKAEDERAKYIEKEQATMFNDKKSKGNSVPYDLNDLDELENF